MDLFLLEYDNGQEYEMQETEVIGIFDNFNTATEYALSCGFERGSEVGYFVRHQYELPGECVEHYDFAYITRFKLNKPEEDMCFKHHYKK